MTDLLKQSLWKHFGASIDMFKNAVMAWPEERWHTDLQFFYNTYHCLVFLDYYLTIPPVNFTSPLPYTLTEAASIPQYAIDDVVPDRIYSREEMLEYIQACREKCRTVIAALTEETLSRHWIAGPGKMNLDLSGADALQYAVLDILLYNLKHVQHHTAQLNLLLRQATHTAPGYVSMAPDEL
jgi:hypothetical protein